MAKQRAFPYLLTLFLFTVFTIQTSLAQDHQHERRERYNPQSFERDNRAEWQNVDAVIKAFGLKESQTIADIGGGSGYFSRPFAKKVGPEGVVYCCDLATNLLEYLQDKAKEEGLHNIVTVYAAMDRPMLPPNSVDHIFFCNTNHHLSNRVEYYKKLKPLLKPGGQVVVVDWKSKKQKVGPPPGHSQPKSVVIDEFRQAGWKVEKDIKDVLEYQNFLIFVPSKR
ncbi:methyltransferase domain-containing protein [bacterium]|nr:methyltransferase domain-containing protein [bacterium]